MTLNEIEKGQFTLDQSRTEKPELKERIQTACNNWAEKSRKYGIVPNSRFFHRGV